MTNLYQIHILLYQGLLSSVDNTIPRPRPPQAQGRVKKGTCKSYFVKFPKRKIQLLINHVNSQAKKLVIKPKILPKMTIFGSLKIVNFDKSPFLTGSCRKFRFDFLSVGEF